jgi:DNA primase large subunit
VKVPFKDAGFLVSKRLVFIHRGVCYVPISELNTIVCNHFKNQLNMDLINAYKHMPTILKDIRLSKLLINLSNHNSIDFNLTETAPVDGDKINLADLDFYSRKAFPPCMKALFVTLRN